MVLILLGTTHCPQHLVGSGGGGDSGGAGQVLRTTRWAAAHPPAPSSPSHPPPRPHHNFESAYIPWQCVSRMCIEVAALVRSHLQIFPFLPHLRIKFVLGAGAWALPPSPLWALPSCCCVHAWCPLLRSSTVAMSPNCRRVTQCQSPGTALGTVSISSTPMRPPP